MSRWKTPEIVKLLEDPAWKITKRGPGGDVDSDGIMLHAKECKDKDINLFVCGFVYEGYITTPSDCEVDLLEVTDGCDSDGGLNVDDLPTCLMYAHVCSRLRKAGHNVVRSLKAFR